MFSLSGISQVPQRPFCQGNQLQAQEKSTEYSHGETCSHLRDDNHFLEQAGGRQHRAGEPSRPHQPLGDPQHPLRLTQHHLRQCWYVALSHHSWGLTSSYKKKVTLINFRCLFVGNGKGLYFKLNTWVYIPTCMEDAAEMVKGAVYQRVLFKNIRCYR